MPVNKLNIDKFLKVLVTVILVTGAFLRIYIYLQNPNLIIDEANIARNIVEKDFADLLKPLSYEQYAPPLFLWIVKSCTLAFGNSEYALKLYPLLCGIASLLILLKLFKKILPLQAAWYPLCLFAVGYIFLQYSAFVKQYMPDIFVTTALLFLAISTDIRTKAPLHFIVVFTTAGSLAIWLSMPSVFILAGIAAYYTVICIQDRQYRKMLIIMFPAGIWFVQFLLYYIYILQPQASSDYLQTFHAPYFIGADMAHNRILMQGLLSVAGGHTAIALYLHLLLILITIVVLARKNLPLLLLLLVPVCSLIFASALKTFSLLDRVSLFITPVLYIGIGYGLHVLVHHLKHVIARVVVYMACIISLISFCIITTDYSFKYEEITEGLDFAAQHNAPAEHVYIGNASVPAFIYYTTIHPDKEHWASFKNAHLLYWYTSYDSLGEQLSKHAGVNDAYVFIHANPTGDEPAKNNEGLSRHLQLVHKLDKPYIRGYIYIKPEPGITSQ